MEIWAADGRNQEIGHVRVSQALLGAMLSEMTTRLEGVAQELQACARFADKVHDEG